MLLDILSALMWSPHYSVMCHFLRLDFPLGYKISLMRIWNYSLYFFKSFFLYFCPFPYDDFKLVGSEANILFSEVIKKVQHYP